MANGDGFRSGLGDNDNPGDPKKKLSIDVSQTGLGVGGRSQGTMVMSLVTRSESENTEQSELVWG
jgi:hypothetical protein